MPLDSPLSARPPPTPFSPGPVNCGGARSNRSSTSPSPEMTSTRAITVPTSAEHVWPWIVQLGQGRGGFYSYDFLENLVGCDIHSADRIVPEWQDVVVGDEVRFAPEVGLAVASLDN